MKGNQTERPLNMAIVLETLSGSSLLEDYQSTRQQALQFYAGDWKKLQSYRDIASKIDEKFDETARQRAFETFDVPKSFSGKRRDSWVNGNGLVVTTGQQPGLFGGPLYTLYKALSAIQLANKLEKELDRIVIPVFWVASEDHDWEEVNHTYFINRDDEVVRTALDNEGHRGQAIHKTPMSNEISETIDQVSQSIGETEFRNGYLELFRSYYREGVDLGTALGEVLLEILGPKGLVVLDSNNTVLKSNSMELMMAELQGAPSTERKLRQWSDSLAKAGYDLQVPILDQAVNLFFENSEKRERIYRNEDAFCLRKSDKTLTLGEIEELSENDLSLLSPNVLLRPIVEASILPVVSYVAGPGELAYYAQLKPLYETHGATMPILFPRHSVTLVEAKVQRKMSRLGLSLKDCERSSQDIFSSIAKGRISESINIVIEKLKTQIMECSDELIGHVNELDPTLEGSVRKSRNTALGNIDGVNQKIIRSFKRKNAETLKQVDSIRSHLFPNGKRQERVLNPFFYLARYGEQFI
ncbi:MAG: bacillithiol biosynthesis cysteine-adding enzyme BshC, partial [bacterium]